MKKIILSLGVLLALSTTASAKFDDFKYKKSNIGSYMFGIYGGAGYSSLTESTIFEGGINTLYMYDAGKRINIGIKSSFKYTYDDIDIYNNYSFDIEPYIGYKVSPNINIYMGYGFEFLTELEKDYSFLGLEYFISQDLILDFKYKNKSFSQYNNIDSDDVIQMNATIPFNFYK